jgi:NADH:ubiquinone oxidoreductase subunit 6 (subunit J)
MSFDKLWNSFYKIVKASKIYNTSILKIIYSLNKNPVLRRFFWLSLTVFFYSLIYYFFAANLARANFFLILICAVLCTVLTIQSLANLEKPSQLNELENKDWRVIIICFASSFIFFFFLFDIKIHTSKAYVNTIKKESVITIGNLVKDKYGRRYCEFIVEEENKVYKTNSLTDKDAEKVMPLNRFYVSYSKNKPHINSVLTSYKDLKIFTKDTTKFLLFDDILSLIDNDSNKSIEMLNTKSIGWYEESENVWINKIIGQKIEIKNSNSFIISSNFQSISFENSLLENKEENSNKSLFKIKGWLITKTSNFIGKDYAFIYSGQRILDE